MIDHFRENLSAHWRETVGFALFLAWVYCALFGCGLSSAVEPIACVPTAYHLERIWLMCGLFEALGGVAGMLIARKVRAADRLPQSNRLLMAAAALAASGSFFIWLAWSDRMLLFDQVFVAGSALSGIAIVLFTVIWSARLRALNEARLEFVIPCAFTVSFLLYFVILLTKESGLIVLLLVAAMCFGSMYFARSDEAPPPTTQLGDARLGVAGCGRSPCSPSPRGCRSRSSASSPRPRCRAIGSPTTSSPFRSPARCRSPCCFCACACRAI